MIGFELLGRESTVKGVFDSVPKKYANWCRDKCGEDLSECHVPVGEIVEALKTMMSQENV
jgi:hypothetical protein